MRSSLLVCLTFLLVTGCNHPSNQTINRDFEHVFGVALPDSRKIHFSHKTFTDFHGDYGLYALASLSPEDFERLQNAFTSFTVFDTNKYIEVVSYPEIVPYFRKATKAYERSITSCFGRCAFIPESN